MGKKVNLSNRTHLKTSFSFLYVFSHIRYVFDIVKKHYQQGLNMKCTMLTFFFFLSHFQLPKALLLGTVRSTEKVTRLYLNR